MAKLNEGDVIEGIFALALAEIFAYGDIDKTRLNKARTKIEPEMFKDGRYDVVIRDTLGKGRGFKTKSFPPDIFTVKLILRLKPKSVEGAYGKDYNVLFKKSKDIGNIDAKINAMIKHAKGFKSKLLKIRDKYLKNNRADKVTFEIFADGIAGETSGGKIKADIDLRIFANGKKQADLHIPYSLKSGSKTLSNLSPYKGLMEMMDKFGLEYVYEDEFAGNLGPGGALERAKTPAQKKAKVQMLTDMYDGFIEGMEDEGNTAAFTKTAFQIINEAAFGDDFATVVDLDKSSVKYMDPKYTNELLDAALRNRRYAKAGIIGSGDNRKLAIYFDDINKPENHLFTYRKKFRVSGSGSMELKLYVEAGKMIYSKY